MIKPKLVLLTMIKRKTKKVLKVCDLNIYQKECVLSQCKNKKNYVNTSGHAITSFVSIFPPGMLSVPAVRNTSHSRTAKSAVGRSPLLIK